MSCLALTLTLCRPVVPSADCTTSIAGVYLAKRRTANHPCPVCGKHYVNEGSLRKHLACHPETSQLSTSLRMWPCSVCQSVFTHESGKLMNNNDQSSSSPESSQPEPLTKFIKTNTSSGLLSHMEHMRMDPKHQFAAQYVLSRAAAERRERELLAGSSLGESTVESPIVAYIFPTISFPLVLMRKFLTNFG